MSFEFYSKWWAGTRKVLDALMKKDTTLQKKLDETKLKSRAMGNQLIGGLFARYAMLVQNLGLCLDQMAQPQKRETVRKLMDSATLRLYELNQELTNIDISDYHYIDGALIELKLLPQSVEILDPIFYFLREYQIEDLWKKVKAGETIYEPPPPPPEELEEGAEVPDGEAPVEGASATPAPAPDIVSAPANATESGAESVQTAAPAAPPPPKKRPKKFEIPIKILTPEEILAEEHKARIEQIVLRIKTMERGRQTRLYFLEKDKEFQYKKAIRAGLKPVPPDLEKQEKVAPQIQKMCRGFAVRQWVKRKERERRLLIGMTEPSWTTDAEFVKLEENLQKRRDIRDQRIREYIEANLNERDRIFRVVAPGLFEDIGDEIREWFHTWYYQVKNFDAYPEEDKGGTIVVVRGETLTPKEWLDEYEKKRREKVKNKGADKAKLKAAKLKAKKDAKEKKRKEKEKAKKEALRKKKKKLKPWDFEMEMEPNTANDPYQEAAQEYVKHWDPRPDADNPEERHYFDIIHEQHCYDVQLEVRQNVDVMMRLELDLLQDALWKDRGKKGKRKKKKAKKKKKGKKKGKKDPTGNRTIEELFQELVNNGIIHSYPKARLSDYLGDLSYAGWNLRLNEFDPPATLGDVRQVIKMECILPLSTTRLKKPKSVIIIGPRQTGKHLLANAILNETQAVLFDLSPEIVAGKYEGTAGMKMLLHLINKMARILQPSIIYLPYVEKTFCKKVPPELQDCDPKRMGKKLQKGIVKTIKPEDRVMVLGVSGQPWLGQAAKIKKCFEKIIFVQRPDYGTIYLYWRQLLMPYHGVDRDIDISCLAKATKYIPLPDIKRAVETVMTPRRIIQLKYNPLRAAELFEPLIDTEPISDKEMKKYAKIYNKTPLGKERGRYNKFADKKREAESKANDKKKKK